MGGSRQTMLFYRPACAFAPPLYVLSRASIPRGTATVVQFLRDNNFDGADSRLGFEMSDKRSAFFVSDRTGITAEMLGHSLLTQFDQVAFSETTLPFIDTPQKAEQAVNEINQAGARDGTRPIVISTLVDVEVSAVLAKAEALVLESQSDE